MDVLVVGANGLLGSNVVSIGLDRGWTISGTVHSTRPAFNIPLLEFDLRSYDAFEEVLNEHDPDTVVNCAAMTDVDGCEADPEAARVVNGEAPGGLATACADRGIAFVHVSTDYVFNGRSRGAYDEDDETNPLQVYGESKLAGERAVREAPREVLTVRLSFVWGIHRSEDELTGFPAWVRGRLQAGEAVPLFTDQRVTPTRAGSAAETLFDLLDRGTSGVYHVACRSCVTPYEFGESLAEELGADRELLAEGAMDDVDRAATRPRNTCLDVGRVEDVLGRAQPTLREEIEAVSDVL